MKTENTTKEARLDFFALLYENAKNNYSDAIEFYERNAKQYKGSSEIDGSNERATTVRNITYEIVESQVSSDIPHPKVDAARYTEKHDRNALTIERLLYSVRDKLPYEELNDIDERYTYIYGGSVWYVEWDNELRLGKEVGGVRLYCLSPEKLIPQPNISSIEDMDYCFLKLTSTRGELSRVYDVEDSELNLAEYETAEGECDEGETATLIVTFYRTRTARSENTFFPAVLCFSTYPSITKERCAFANDAVRRRISATAKRRAFTTETCFLKSSLPT